MFGLTTCKFIKGLFFICVELLRHIQIVGHLNYPVQKRLEDWGLFSGLAEAAGFEVPAREEEEPEKPVTNDIPAEDPVEPAREEDPTNWPAEEEDPDKWSAEEEDSADIHRCSKGGIGFICFCWWF